MEQLKQFDAAITRVPVVSAASASTFYDLSPLLASPLYSQLIARLASQVKTWAFDTIVGVGSRGFCFACPVAYALQKDCVLLNKPESLPLCGPSDQRLAAGDYPDRLEVQQGLLTGRRCVLVDEFLGTGGTLEAAAQLLAEDGAVLEGVLCPVELVDLQGRARLPAGAKVSAILRFSRRPTVPGSVQTFEQTDPFSWEERITLERKYGLSSRDSSFTTPRFFVMWHPSLQELGEAFLAQYPEYQFAPISWGHFPDGSPNLRFFRYLENAHIVFLLNTLDFSVFAEQLMVLSILPRQHICSLTIVIFFYGVGTMERVDVEGSVATAESTAKMISNIYGQTQVGAPSVILFDPHVTTERFYFADTVCPRLASGLPALLRKVAISPLELASDDTRGGSEESSGGSIGTGFREAYEAIVFPDQGAYKRFSKEFEATTPMVVCAKTRDGDQRVVQVNDYYNVPPLTSFRKLLIVDDLVQSGNTLIECARALKATFGQATSVSVYVTHGVFPRQSWRKLADSPDISRVFVTNSISHPILRFQKKFVILDLTPELAELVPRCGEPKAEARDYVLSQNTRVPAQLHHWDLSRNVAWPQPKSHPIRVLLASKSASKIRGVWEVFTARFRLPLVLDFRAQPSLISDQPLGEETKRGLLNRLKGIKGEAGYDFYVAVESGIEKQAGEGKADLFLDRCWAAVHTAEENKTAIGVSYGVPVRGEFASHVAEIFRLRESGEDPNAQCRTPYGMHLQKAYACPNDDWYSLVGFPPRWFMVFCACQAAGPFVELVPRD